MNVRKLKKYVTQRITSDIADNLTYHGLHHTLSVYNVCNDYIRRLHIPAKEAFLLRTAALTHDLGILYQYQNHEQKGIEIVQSILPEMGYTKSDIDIVCNLIEATRLPQRPKNLLEKIICDADLDYLGTDKFYEIGQTLFQEFLEYNIVANEKEWDMLQINFLASHTYHTVFAKKYRQPIKQAHLMELRKKWKIHQ